MTELSEDQKRDFEAAAFRRLVEHLRAAQRRAEHRPDEPRRLLPQLPVELVSRRGRAQPASNSPRTQSREIIYGMPYAEWQAMHQSEASEAKKAAFETNRPKDH